MELRYLKTKNSWLAVYNVNKWKVDLCVFEPLALHDLQDLSWQQEIDLGGLFRPIGTPLVLVERERLI
jgi:hypothetical protein